MIKLLKLMSGGRHRAEFECMCGTKFTTYKYNVFSGHTKSCGCRVKQGAAYNYPSEHTSWRNMKARCKYPYMYGSEHYVGKGVKVCKRWEQFENFLSDMGPKPTPKHSIDRIDNSKGYDPSNCRWATAKEQANNTSQNRLLTYEGVTLNVGQWSERVGVKANTLIYSLRRGWTVERTLGQRQEFKKAGRL